MVKKKEKEPSVSDMKRALADMVWYFAPQTGKNDEEMTTGGIIALEHAFNVLGLPNPVSKLDFVKKYSDKEVE